jgi:hypothetical protein
MCSRNAAKLNARINLHYFFLACEKFAHEIEGMWVWPLCCGSHAKLCFVFVPQLVLSWEGHLERLTHDVVSYPK